MNLRIPKPFALRPGSVLETYPGLRLGNYLYFALQAHRERKQGRRTWVLDSGLDRLWRKTFPGLGPLLAHASTAAFRRVRHIPPRFHQEYGVDYTREDLEHFVADVILPALPETQDTPDLVVNIRRGDYYSSPGLRRIYAFDVPAFVEQALRAAVAAKRVTRLCVVSDDLDYCRSEFRWISDYADSVTFGPQEGGPAGDFWLVASARRLVLTNSTFSYWGAYVSQIQHGDAHGGTWVPAFHQRNVDDGRPWQHDPRWHAVPVDLPAPTD